MPNHLLDCGLYVVERYSPEKGVKHVAVLDVGNRSGLADWGPHNARLLELSVSGLRFDPYDANQGWAFVRRVANESEAVGRIHCVLGEDPQPYDAVLNNCEHLVSFVESGERKSPQVRGWAIAAGLVIGMITIASVVDRAA